MSAGTAFRCCCCHGEFPEHEAVMEEQLGPICGDCSKRSKLAEKYLRLYANSGRGVQVLDLKNDTNNRFREYKQK